MTVIISNAYLIDNSGAGRYRNDETGLEREFTHKPFRGHWTLVARRRVSLPARLDEYGIPQPLSTDRGERNDG